MGVHSIIDKQEDVIFTVKDIYPILKHLLTNKETMHTPILLIGDSGIGKTAITRQLSKEQKWDYIDVRFSGHLPEDIKIPTIETWTDKYYKNKLGVPDTTQPGISIKLMNLIKKAFVHDGTSGLLDLEEINRASPETLNVLFQLIGDRALDEHVMNPNWRIIGSINPDTDDKFTVSILDFAFKRRWLVFKLKPDLMSFLKWATDSNIHPAVIKFLRENPDALYKEISDDVNLMPAIWERVSNILYSLVHAPNNKVGTDILKASLGKSIGISLWNIFLNYKQTDKEFTVSDMLGTYYNSSEQQKYVRSLTEKGHISELTTLGTGFASSLKEADEHILQFCMDVPLDVAQCVLTLIKDIPMLQNEHTVALFKILHSKLVTKEQNELDILNITEPVTSSATDNSVF